MNIYHLAERYKDDMDATLPERLMAEAISIAYEMCHEIDHLQDILENSVLDDGIPSSIALRHLRRLEELSDAFREPLKDEY